MLAQMSIAPSVIWSGVKMSYKQALGQEWGKRVTKLNFGIQYGKEIEVGIPSLVTNSLKTAEPTYKNYLSDMLLIL